MLDFKEASNTDLTETQNTDLTEFPHYSKTPRETDTANNCHKLQQNLQGENTDPDKTPVLSPTLCSGAVKYSAAGLRKTEEIQGSLQRCLGISVLRSWIYKWDGLKALTQFHPKLALI